MSGQTKADQPGAGTGLPAEEFDPGLGAGYASMTAPDAADGAAGWVMQAPSAFGCACGSVLYERRHAMLGHSAVVSRHATLEVSRRYFPRNFGRYC
jgi:hypothetical protein